MPNDSFRFKEFTVRQSHSAMKVGTDGVILGAWADVTFEHSPSILDVGSGTGLIALMVAQRNKDAIVDAVEIEQGAAIEAKHNFENSPFCKRLRLYQDDFQTFAKRCKTEGKSYDLIVSNPPYFNGTYKSVDAQRTAARHTELLPTDELIEGVLLVINPNGGRFAAIFPYADAAIFIAKAAAKGLYCSKILEIYGKEGRGAKRMAAEFSTARCNNVINEQLTILDSTERYSQAYRELTNDFYFRF